MDKDAYKRFLEIKENFSKELKEFGDKHFKLFDEFVLDKNSLPKDGEKPEFEDDYMVLFFDEFADFVGQTILMKKICELSHEEFKEKGLSPGDILAGIQMRRQIRTLTKNLSSSMGFSVEVL